MSEKTLEDNKANSKSNMRFESKSYKHLKVRLTKKNDIEK